ncbi:unnamed protein product, partial [Phaeothamnion confervicola]
ERRTPRAPEGLGTRGRKTWRELWSEYDFSDAPERLLVLEDLCRTVDMVDRLQTVVSGLDDLRVEGAAKQPVAAPEVSELRYYRQLMVQLVKALDLPSGDETTLTFSQRGNRARWHGGNRGTS